jgi:Uma2 family endonuclease
MTVEMVAPAWMHEQITAEQYASWTAEQCVGIEIVDGMVLVSPSASKRHNRLARLLANALDAAAGPDWNADTDFDVRLQDVPLNNRRPDVTVYRAESIDVTPTRPEHVLLVVEVVSPGSETTDRIVKVDQYARAGIQFYWRIEQAATGVPLLYTYVLDPATRRVLHRTIDGVREDMDELRFNTATDVPSRKTASAATSSRRQRSVPSDVMRAIVGPAVAESGARTAMNTPPAPSGNTEA